MSSETVRQSRCATAGTEGDAALLMDVLLALGRVASEALQVGPDEERLTAAQFRCLMCLAERDRMAGELARSIGVTPSSITSTIDVLVQRGFAGRAASPDDRRCTLISLAEPGRACLNAAKARMAVGIDDVLGRMPDRERRTLRDGLSAFRLALAEAERERRARPGSEEETRG